MIQPISAAQNLLDNIGIDAICDLLVTGESQADIAKRHNVSTSKLSAWLLGDPTRMARAREARSISAEAWLDKAERVLLDLPSDGTGADIARARELSQFYRRAAAIRNPREYGDRIDVSGKIDHEHSVTSLFNAITSRPSLIYEETILIEAETVAE